MQFDRDNDAVCTIFFHKRAPVGLHKSVIFLPYSKKERKKCEDARALDNNK